MRCFVMTGIVLSGFMLSACSTWSLFENFGKNAHAKSKAQLLAPETVSDLSSSGPMVLNSARVIVDTNSAFQNKLELIKNAESEIRLIYNTYSDDFTGSAFTSELITAAKDRNLKVKILVDFWANYERLDYFKHLEKAGEGRIQIRFYGIPSEKVLRGAMYETSTCNPANTTPESACVFPASPTWFSKIFLTGLYSRNQTMMELAKSLSKLYATAPQAKQVNELANDILQMDLSEDVDSEKEFVLAIETLNTPLNPFVEAVRSKLVFAASHNEYLQNVTDHTQHRMLVVDGFRFQLGGQDIEDSEETASTDFYGESAAALNIQAAYDRIFAFSAMVGDLQTAQSLVPNDYALNPVPFQKSLALCLLAMKSTAAELQTCVDTNMPRMEEYETADSRQEAISESIQENARLFYKNRAPVIAKSWKPGGDQISTADLATIKAYYVENLTFTKKDPSQRLYVPESDLASENGKYVHSLWAKSLENTCAVAQATKTRKRVIIQSESLFLPGGLVQTLGKMMNGQWKCKYVDIAFITNSTDSGEPRISNVFSRHQMQSLLRFQRLNRHEASLKFYEYRSSTHDGKMFFKNKVYLLGDDLLLGSFDTNIRSFAVDTNSGILLKNAKQSAEAYAAYIDSLQKSGYIIDLSDYYATVSAEDLEHESSDVLKALLPKSKTTAVLAEIGNDVKSTTRQVLEIVPAPSSVRAPASAGLPTAAEIIQRQDSTWKNF